ncbi:MAG: GAF domain-containing protein [Anaerolineales bacterium]|nr:GAF domain-containing protein [Anaerolineales bacterium]
MLLIALIPLVIIAVRDTIQTQQALTKGAEISLKAGATQTANSLDNFIQNTLSTVSSEAQLADFITYLTVSPTVRTGTVIQARTLDLLENLSKKDSTNIISYALVDTNGNVILDNASDILRNESTEPYFLPVQFSDNPVVSYVTYEEDKTTSITFASAVKNINGGYIGVLRVKYRSAVLQDVITKSIGPSTDTLVLLLDQLSIRLADSQNPELIQKSIVPLNPVDFSIAVNNHRLLNTSPEEQATNYTDFELALDNAVNQPFFQADITPNINGDDTIAVAFLQTQPWVIAYSRPTTIFLADVQRQIRTNIIFVLGTSIVVALIAALIANSLTNPIIALSKVANSISQGDYNARANVKNTDEIGVLALAFNSMTDQLQSILVGLEQRIDERTADLKKSTLELETIAEVARDITIIRDLSTLLNVSANLIRERFNYYHVGIYLIDDAGEFVYLRAASGMSAQEMLDQNYKLKIGQEGLTGNVVRTGRAYIAQDVGKDAVRFQNPFLPQTHSEIALPLRSRNITIGILDIQTDIESAFEERSTNILQLLADQLAAAIENAQLTQQVEGTFTELNTAYRLQTQSVWQSTLNNRENSAYEYNGMQMQSVPQNLPIDLLKQLEAGKAIVTQTNASDVKKTLLVPITVRNQVIGVIGLEQEDPNRTWTEEEMAVAEAAANRAGLTLENARLLEESQRRAIKERTIFEATARIGSALNVENILEATAEELEKILSGSEVILQFQSDSDQKSGK